MELDSPFSSSSASSANSCDSRPDARARVKSVRATDPAHSVRTSCRKEPRQAHAHEPSNVVAVAVVLLQRDHLHRSTQGQPDAATALTPSMLTRLLGDELRHARAHALRHVRDGDLVVLVQAQERIHNLARRCERRPSQRDAAPNRRGHACAPEGTSPSAPCSAPWWPGRTPASHGAASAGHAGAGAAPGHVPR
jgi:hypothetical protein